jgi:hypothetical protein
VLRTRSLAAVGLVLTLPLLAVAQQPATAAGERPVAYVNPDTGKATFNPNARSGSDCASPDQSDTQPLGDEADGTGNVHVDACLFDGSTKVDTQAAFEVSGVGKVTGCPDADMTGPKTATKTDTSCLHTGFEAANSEYHVRVTSATAGVQTVTFCADPEGDGCANAESTSVVRITWGAPTGGVAAGGTTTGLPSGPVAVALLALLGALGATGVAVRAQARR